MENINEISPERAEMQAENDAIRRSLFRYLCLGLAVGALVWGSICLFNDLILSAIIPFGYVVFTGLNLLMCRVTGITKGCMAFQVVISLLLPFIFQSSLGGQHNSGMVMLWSLAALAGVLTFQAKRESYFWVLTEMGFLLTWIITDPVIDNGDNAFVLTDSAYKLLLAFNMCGVLCILFALCLFFVRTQGKLRRKLYDVGRDLRLMNASMAARNREVDQSIAYAKVLQNAVLPDLTKFRDLFSSHFIINRSKDLIGGDLYWCGRAKNYSFMVLLDCTGHGIPGGYLSMLCHTTLNEIIYSGNANCAASVIKILQNKLDSYLNRDRSGSKDGAEMAVLCFDHLNKRVSFSGLGCSLIMANDRSIEVIKGKRAMPALMQGSEDLRDISLNVLTGTRCFLYSDGVTDQFNATDQKKLGTRRLEELIVKVNQNELHSVCSELDDNLKNWQGTTDQIDDILLIGLEINDSWIKRATNPINEKIANV